MVWWLEGDDRLDLDWSWEKKGEDFGLGWVFSFGGGLPKLPLTHNSDWKVSYVPSLFTPFGGP